MHKTFNDPLLAMEPPIALVTLRRQDGSEALLRTSAAPLLAAVSPEVPPERGLSDCASEGGTFREPAAVRIPEDPSSTDFHNRSTQAGAMFAVGLVLIIMGACAGLWLAGMGGWLK